MLPRQGQQTVIPINCTDEINLAICKLVNYPQNFPTPNENVTTSNQIENAETLSMNIFGLQMLSDEFSITTKRQKNIQKLLEGHLKA